jgi:hypothetical protein
MQIWNLLVCECVRELALYHVKLAQAVRVSEDTLVFRLPITYADMQLARV